MLFAIVVLEVTVEGQQVRAMSEPRQPRNSYGSVSLSTVQQEEAVAVADSRSHKLFLTLNFLGCLVVGPINFVVYKVMYDSFGQGRSFFVSQGVNFLYVVYGGVILHLMTRRGEITPEMYEIPHYKFVIMGTLDALGGFLAAMGAVNTSGSLQQLMNQTLIPFTMFLSWAILGRGSNLYQIVGAMVIMLGVWVVLIPTETDDESQSPISANGDLVFLSNILYMASNIPIALSCVYKEMGFTHMQVHVIYLTQMVSIYQLIIGFALGILQTIPGIGSENGSSLRDIASQFVSGLQCFLFLDEKCRESYTFFLLTGYCVLNFAFNITGLHLVKHDSAVLSTLTNALVLPLTCLAFMLPILGHYQEPFDVVTIFGLCLVLCGFAIWRVSSLTWVATSSTESPHTGMTAESRIPRKEEYQLLHFEARSPSPLGLSCYGYVPHENRHRSRSNSFDSTYSAPDAFYDRVIVLSLNKAD